MELGPVDKIYTRQGNTDHEGNVRDMSGRSFTYGTAGFRCNASELPFAMFRMGALATAVSRAYKGQSVAVMITASHNPEHDNGLKLISPMGEMLSEHWEQTATELVNAKDGDFASVYTALCEKKKLSGDGSVLTAYDTRVSGPHLHQAVVAGVIWAGGHPTSVGQLTTPQLHFIVRCTNDPHYGQASLQGYNDKLGTAFVQLHKLVSANADSESPPLGVCQVHIDCANGIGASAVRHFVEHNPRLPVQLTVHNQTGQLNHRCGADYVKLNRVQPEGVSMQPGQVWTSFDGDADRVLFYYIDQAGVFQLLDGDRIALLLLKFVQQQLSDGLLGEWKCGLVQTAYANGASMQYAKQLGVQSSLVPTGVKHLHKAAKQYDVGVYFEANGHGTLLFSAAFKQHIRLLASQHESDASVNRRAQILSHFIDLVNETVGDALSDLLCVLVALTDCGWSVTEWTQMYTELHSVQLKVKVHDRTKIVCTWDETRCEKPEGLQSLVDEAVLQCKAKRAFVRPSGTEDIVRVYVEADTLECAKETAKLIEEAVKLECCSSIGGDV